jgi:hypothetical protein
MWSRNTRDIWAIQLKACQCSIWSHKAYETQFDKPNLSHHKTVACSHRHHRFVLYPNLKSRRALITIVMLLTGDFGDSCHKPKPLGIILRHLQRKVLAGNINQIPIILFQPGYLGIDWIHKISLDPVAGRYQYSGATARKFLMFDSTPKKMKRTSVTNNPILCRPLIDH